MLDLLCASEHLSYIEFRMQLIAQIPVPGAYSRLVVLLEAGPFSDTVGLQCGVLIEARGNNSNAFCCEFHVHEATEGFPWSSRWMIDDTPEQPLGTCNLVRKFPFWRAQCLHNVFTLQDVTGRV